MERLRLFPLNTVLFPDAVLSLHIFEPRSSTEAWLESKSVRVRDPA